MSWLSLPTEVTPKHLLFVLAPIFLYWALPLLYGVLFSPLRKVPGPFWARVSRLWEFHSLWKGHSNRDFIRLHEKYGPIVRIAPNRYSVNRPEDVKTIYELGGKFIKSEYYAPILVGDRKLDNIFPMIDNDEHKERRRKISALYTMSAMVSYEEAVDKITAVLSKKLRQFADEDRPFDFPHFMQYYAFDVIGQITFNQSFGMMENECDPTGMIQGIHQLTDYLAHIGLLPNLHGWIVKFRKIFGKDEVSRKMIGYTLSQIERHRKENEKPSNNSKYRTFLEKMLDMEAAHKVSTASILDAAGSNIGAGSDTTAITLSSALYYLYKHPEKLVKLRHEIDTMAVDGRISDPVTFQEAQSMPYLQAVIKESLRVHPAVGTILPRVVPKGGVKLGGFDFPEGTHVGANSWVLHYNKDVFGPDADVYQPERWLQPKADRDPRNGMMFAFGGGSRTCIGKNISLLEINKVLPQIVRKFDIVLDDKALMETYCSWFVYPKFQVRTKWRDGVK